MSTNIRSVSRTRLSRNSNSRGLVYSFLGSEKFGLFRLLVIQTSRVAKTFWQEVFSWLQAPCRKYSNKRGNCLALAGIVHWIFKPWHRKASSGLTIRNWTAQLFRCGWKRCFANCCRTLSVFSLWIEKNSECRWREFCPQVARLINKHGAAKRNQARFWNYQDAGWVLNSSAFLALMC